MLEIDSVTLSFGDRAVLSGCYLSCRPGEITGLLGRNGSGKSCLLKIMFGSLAADFKHLRIDNQLITTRGFKTRQIAYLPQATFLPPFVKVSELLGTIVIGKEILLNSELNNGDFSNHRVGDLSGGKLRFLECLWILNQPAPYILLDEPFSGVAPILVESLQGAIREAGKTKAIVLTDHIYRPLLEISDRVVLLHNNSIYAIRSDDDLIRYSYVPDFS